MMHSPQVEYGGYVVRNKNGSLALTHITTGVVGLVRLPSAPDNAIARIHTHPDQLLDTGVRITFDFPSGRDAVNANQDNIYGIVVTPRNFHVVPLGRNTYHSYPRTQTAMPPPPCPSRTVCSSPYE